MNERPNQEELLKKIEENKKAIQLTADLMAQIADGLNELTKIVNTML